MATKKTKKSEALGEPVVTVGSHLTVTRYPNGKTELVWDDDALMRDVLEALASATPEMKPAVKAKTARTKKAKSE
jgi:hypothetical protein